MYTGRELMLLKGLNDIKLKQHLI